MKKTLLILLSVIMSAVILIISICVINFGYSNILKEMGGVGAFSALWLYGTLSPNPPKPKITEGGFPFRLEYEIKGERFVLEDTLICEYKIGWDGSKKVYQLDQHWKNDTSKYFVHTLYGSEAEGVLLQYVSPFGDPYGGATFMGKTKTDADFSKPKIREAKFKPWSDAYPHEEDLFLDYGFKIISYECAKPIENKFK